MAEWGVAARQVTSTSPAGRVEAAACSALARPALLDACSARWHSAQSASSDRWGAGDRLHPRRDDAVLAPEILVADLLRVSGERLEQGPPRTRDLRLDGSLVGYGHWPATVSHEDAWAWGMDASTAVWRRRVLAAEPNGGFHRRPGLLGKRAERRWARDGELDRLLRSSVTPACFRPFMNCP